MKRVYVIFGLALLAIAGMFALFINATITTRRMSDSYYGNKDSKYYSVQTTDLKCSYHLNQDDLSYSLKIVNPLIYFEKETNTYDCLHEMLPIKNDELVFPSHYDGLPITRIYVDDEKVPIYPNNLKRIVIPGTVEELGDYTFYRCKAQNIVLPNSITKMGREVFSDCFNLRYIELPSGLKSIPEAAFSNCYNLTEVIMKDGIKSIDNYAFSDCENLKQIDIPNGVTSIGYYVFDGCKRMKNISIPSSLNEINTNSFSESIN